MIYSEKEFEIAFLDFQDDNMLKEFWQYFDEYIDELIDLSEPLVLEYFHSDEYRQAILFLGKRLINPLFIMKLINKGQLIGFCSYCIYHNENAKAFLLEIGIDKNLRNKGLGKWFYKQVEFDIKNKGGKFIELTPYPKDKELFWQKLGFCNTGEKDEDGKYIFRLNF